MTSGRTSGWSPRRTRAASTPGARPTSGDSAPSPSRSELDNPASGFGLTTTRAPVRSTAASTAAPRLTEDDDDLAESRGSSRIQDMAEQRPPVERREDLHGAEARAGSGGKDQAGRASRIGHRSALPDDDGDDDQCVGRGWFRTAGLRLGQLEHRRPRTAVSRGDDLGQDRECRFGRRSAAEVESDRAVEPGEIGLAHTRFEQPRPAIALRLARADGTDVAAAPPQRLDDGRLVELDVVAEDGDRVGRAEADLLGHLVRPAHHEPVHVREPLAGRECLPAIDHHRLEPEFTRQADERDRDLDRADDHEARPDREDLDEVLAIRGGDGPGRATAESLQCAADQFCVRRPITGRGRVTGRIRQPAIVMDDQEGLGRRAVARLVRPELGRWRIGGEWRSTAAPCSRSMAAAVTAAGTPARRARRSSRRRPGRRPRPARR